MSQTATCPICKKTLASETALRSEFFPFCSERCRHVDLFRWSEGKYAIVEPLTELPDEVEQPRDENDHEADSPD